MLAPRTAGHRPGLSASAPTARSSWPGTGGGWTGTVPGGWWVPLPDVQEAASHADPRTTMRYDRARTILDRHAADIVAAYVAGAAR